MSSMFTSTRSECWQECVGVEKSGILLLSIVYVPPERVGASHGRILKSREMSWSGSPVRCTWRKPSVAIVGSVTRGVC